jgi:hypothetical protein
MENPRIKWWFFMKKFLILIMTMIFVGMPFISPAENVETKARLVL